MGDAILLWRFKQHNKCYSCSTIDTPMWRNQQIILNSNIITLRYCNSCGLRFKKLHCECGGVYDNLKSRICMLCFKKIDFL